jgi:hypothetical protein
MRRALSASLVILLAAGCSARHEPAPVTSGSPAVSATTSASPSPSSAPALTAADGTDAKACRDGRCQIIVRKTTDIDLRGKFSCDGITMSFRAPNVTHIFVAVHAGDDVQAKVTGTGNLRLAYGLTITVEKTDKSGALVRLAPEHNNPKAHTGTGTEGFSLYSGNG